MFDHNSPLDFFDVLYTNTFQDVRIQTYESCDMLYGSKIKNGGRYAIRLDFCLSIY